MEPIAKPTAIDSYAGQGTDRNFYLPRLPVEHYQANAVVHWTMPLARRSTGWLNEIFHARFREIMLHAAAREGLFLPDLLPDAGSSASGLDGAAPGQ